MAKTPLQDAVTKWGSRFAQAQKAGLDIKKVAPIAKYDLQKVLGGSQGLTDMEANLAMIAGAGGQSVLGDPKPKQTSALGILGKIGGDIGGIVKGFLPGIAKGIYHLPSEVQAQAEYIAHSGDAKWMEQHGYDPKAAQFSLSGIAAGLRNTVKDPHGNIAPLSLVPGLVDIAQATTGAGREQMRQHPVGSVLDVLPLAKGVGEVAGASKAAEVARAGGEISPALDALQEGKLVRAGLEKLPAGHLESGASASVASKTIETMQKLGLDPETAQKIVRPYSIGTRKLRRDAVTYYKGTIEPLIKGMDAKELETLYDEASHYFNDGNGHVGKAIPEGDGFRLEPITPEHQAILRSVREIQASMADVGVERGSLLRIPGPDNRAHIYSADTNVARTYQRINGLEDRLIHETDPRRAAGIQAQLIEAHRTMIRQMTELPPADMHDWIEHTTRYKTEQFARTKWQGDQLQTALRDIHESTSFQDFHNIVGEKEFNAILKDSMSTWVQQSRLGLDPIWMKHVPESRLGGLLYPKPLPDRFITPSSFKSKTFNFAPHVHNIAVGVTAAGVDVLRADATKTFVERYISPLGRRAGDIKDELRNSLRWKYNNPDELASAVDTMMQKNYNRFDPAHPFTTDNVYAGYDNDLIIPKHIHKTLEGLMNYQNRLPIAGTWDKTLNIFKFSVLTGPRHIAHVALGGMMFMMGREPGGILELPKAWKMVKNGEMPVEIPGSLYDIETDHLFHIAAGKSLGSHLKQVVGDGAKALAHFEEFVSNVERTATYLSAAKRGLDHEVALQAAQKTFVDLDGLMPVERLIIKRAFPFYAFTRHLFRYLLTYPVDHPIRASILSRFAENEQEEWKTGLPLKYQQLFFLGGGDMKTAVDFKSLNPFRSFSNDFSLVGFVQSLNPLAGAGLQAMGINTVNAVPELYPEVQYDPQSGTLQAKRKNFGVSLLESYIPETQVLDSFVGANDRLRSLRQTNPDAYRRALFSALNIPFAWGKVSLSEIRGKAEVARFNAAQRALATGEKTGNFSQAEQFPVVPFRGQLVPPEQVASSWQQLQDALSGVSPKAVIPPYRGKRRG